MAASALAQKQSTAWRVDSVLELMTLEEKVGQMNQYNGLWNATGPAPVGGDAATNNQKNASFTHIISTL